MTVAERSEKELFELYLATRDPTIRNKVVERHLQLVEVIARRFDRRGVPLEDLVQVAQIGLIKAIERYDPAHGAAFTTYATPTIVGEIKRHFRDKTWAMRVPRSLKDLHVRIRPAVGALHHELGRSPTIAEIAERVGTTEDFVLEAIEAGAAYRADSMDATGAGGDGAPLATILSHHASPDLAEIRVTVRSLMAQLPERERTAVFLRYFEDRTQAEIAEHIGVSQVHVSRLLRRALSTLGPLAEADAST